jgi:hypothetical protein
VKTATWILAITLLMISTPAGAQGFQQTLGAPITAVGPGFLPEPGTILWQQQVQASGTLASSISVGWNQGWNCRGSDGDASNPANCPGLALIDIEQRRVIGSVIVCETSGHPNSSCKWPQWYDKPAEWTGPITPGDHVGIEVIQQGKHCIGGLPWPVCSSSHKGSPEIGTCGGGVIWINATFEGTLP